MQALTHHPAQPSVSVRVPASEAKSCQAKLTDGIAELVNASVTSDGMTSDDHRRMTIARRRVVGGFEGYSDSVIPK